MSNSLTTVLKSDRPHPRLLTLFFGLLGLLVLLTIFTLLFSQQIVTTVPSNPQVPSFMLHLLVGLLATLLLAVGYRVFRLVRDLRLGRPGTKLKVRISLFFLLTALVAAFPLSLLSLSFMDTAIKVWSSQQWGKALEGGLQTAIDYHKERIEGLKDTAGSTDVIFIVLEALASKDPPAAMGQLMSNVKLRADALEVFDEAGKSLLAYGPIEARLGSGVGLPGEEGPLPKQTKGKSTVLRQLRIIPLPSQYLSVVLSVVLPPGFEEASRQLTAALENYNQILRSSESYRTLLFLFYLLLALPILLMALLISLSQSEELIRPLLNLESATRRIATGDYSTRLLDPDKGDLAFLAESFNTMTAELASSRTKLLQTEKITAWQEIARRLAHELRNPLTPIRLSAERILRRSQTDPAHLAEIVEPAVGAILTEVVRLDALLKEFAGFARLPAPQKTLVTLKPLVEELLSTYQAAHPDLVVSSEGLSSDIQVLVDPTQLEQVFTNLFKNSVEAMSASPTKGAGRLTVVANLVKKDSASYCRVQIHDTGPGIPADLKDRVFQPYVTTKPEGTGLGLAIVERILFDHNGRVWFESQPDFGTTFFLDLPTEDHS